MRVSDNLTADYRTAFAAWFEDGEDYSEPAWPVIVRNMHGDHAFSR